MKVYADTRPKDPVLPASFTIEKEVPVTKEKYDSVKRLIETQVTKPIPPPESKKTEAPSPPSDFRKAVYAILESGSTLDFLDVVAERKTQPNYWNYKYTYSSKIKVPGEKYSMVYRFPFDDSPLDFVTVFSESDAYDTDFVAKYRAVENRLIKDFPKSQGWVSSCSPNDDKSKVPDLEFKNAYLGSIIFDYQKTPKGKHILYLRFLPNNN